MAQTAVPTETLFQSILESAPDAVAIINDRGRIVLANDQMLELFGYTRHELLGQQVEILIPEALRGRHERHRSAYQTDPRTRPMGIGLDLLAVKKNGTTFPVEISLSSLPSEGGMLVTAVIRDITVRKRASNELERQVQLRTAHLNTLLQLSQELFSARGLDVVLQRSLGHVMGLANEARWAAIYLSDEGGKRLGLRASAGLGPLPRVALPAERGVAGRAFRSGLVQVSDAVTDLAELCGDGQELQHGYILALPLLAHGTVIGVLLICGGGPISAESRAILDGLAHLTAAAISEERSSSAAASLSSQLADLEEQQRTMAARLNNAEAGMLQAARLAAVGQLAASVAHEINNPLYAARNCLYLLEEDLPAHLHDTPYLKIARDELGRIAMIIERMRDFYRPARGDLAPCDLNRLLEETLAVTSLNTRHSTIGLIFTPESAMPPVVCDADQLRQVFLNLLLNAVDAMPAGGTITVRTQTRTSLVMIEIQDTGIGMPPEVHQHLFEPFFTTKSNGTGLGLSISAHIVTQHGGRIEAESVEGQGSTFRVILPIHGGTI